MGWRRRGERIECKLQSLEDRIYEFVDVAPWNASNGYMIEREPQRAYHGDYPSAPQAGARAGSRVSAGGEGGATRGTCAQYPKLGSRARVGRYGSRLICRFPVPPGEAPWRLVHVA